MLNEGRRRRERGTDVVVGFVETHGRARTADQIGDLEVVARRTHRVPGRHASRRWTSTPSWRAAPEVALVDELAHTNVPGSRNDKRWQDVRGAARRRHRRDLHRQHPAPRVAQRRGRAHHRGEPAGDDPRRGRPGRRSDRAGRHDARGPAPPDGPRQHLRGRARSTPPWPTTSGSATSAPCGSWPCSGWPTSVDDVARGLPGPPRHHPAVGDAGAGASWPSPARPGSEHLIRRAARIAQRAHGELLGVHVAGRHGPGRAPTRTGCRSTAGCSRRWAASTARSPPATSPPPWSTSPGPRTPPRSCSAPAAGPAGASSPAAR